MRVEVEHGISPLVVFVSAFGLAASAGLAALLQFGKSVTWGSALSSMLYSGMSGLMLTMFWYDKMKNEDNIILLLSGCIAVGLTGAKASDMVLNFFAGKLNLTVKTDDKDEKK